jgi:hypothetical protein
MEKLSITAYQHIWSALNQPHLTNHSGFTMLNLFLNNTRSALQKSLLEEFVRTKNPNNSETILVEMQNILNSNPEVEQKIREAIKEGKHDPLMDLPLNNANSFEGSTFTKSKDRNWNLLIGVGLLILGIVLTCIPGGSGQHRVYFGLMAVGVWRIIKGFAG